MKKIVMLSFFGIVLAITNSAIAMPAVASFKCAKSEIQYFIPYIEDSTAISKRITSRCATVAVTFCIVGHGFDGDDRQNIRDQILQYPGGSSNLPAHVKNLFGHAINFASLTCSLVPTPEDPFYDLIYKVYDTAGWTDWKNANLITAPGYVWNPSTIPNTGIYTTPSGVPHQYIPAATSRLLIGDLLVRSFNKKFAVQLAWIGAASTAMVAGTLYIVSSRLKLAYVAILAALQMIVEDPASQQQLSNSMAVNKVVDGKKVTINPKTKSISVDGVTVSYDPQTGKIFTNSTAKNTFKDNVEFTNSPDGSWTAETPSACTKGHTDKNGNPISDGDC